MQRFVATPHNALSVRKRPLSRNRDSSYKIGIPMVSNGMVVNRRGGVALKVSGTVYGCDV